MGGIVLGIGLLLTEPASLLRCLLVCFFLALLLPALCVVALGPEIFFGCSWGVAPTQGICLEPRGKRFAPLRLPQPPALELVSRSMHRGSAALPGCLCAPPDARTLQRVHLMHHASSARPPLHVAGPWAGVTVNWREWLLAGSRMNSI